jgi:hypothetical protein
MQRYEIDEYVHEDFGPDDVNLNCVFSNRKKRHASEQCGFEIDTYNGWLRASEGMNQTRREAVLRRVCEIESWRVPTQMTDLVVPMQDMDTPQALVLAFVKAARGQTRKRFMLNRT